MRVFVKTAMNGIPETETEYAAWQGFQALGFQPEFFQDEMDLSECRPDDLIVAGISITKRVLQSYGISIPEYDYPEELNAFLGRKIWQDTLDHVLSAKDMFPVFIKPVRDKAFVGTVLRTEADMPRLRQTKMNEPVLCSELVEFQAEWRAFIRYGRIWDVRPYRGDWHMQYDPDILDRAVSAYTGGPAGYAMDFGVTEDGRTLLVEVNDGFALGSYGLDPIQYAKLLSARWSELTGICDECDIFFEGADWKKTKIEAGKNEELL